MVSIFKCEHAEVLKNHAAPQTPKVGGGRRGGDDDDEVALNHFFFGQSQTKNSESPPRGGPENRGTAKRGDDDDEVALKHFSVRVLHEEVRRTGGRRRGGDDDDEVALKHFSNLNPSRATRNRGWQRAKRRDDDDKVGLSQTLRVVVCDEPDAVKLVRALTTALVARPALLRVPDVVLRAVGLDLLDHERLEAAVVEGVL
jgi:hypothetical protein